MIDREKNDLMVMEELDLLEERVIRLIERLKSKSMGLDPERVEGLKAENRELKRKLELLKDKINKMLKQLDKLEG